MSSRNRIDEIIDEIEGLQSQLVQELKAKEQEFFTRYTTDELSLNKR
ncbi:MAG: hypothetical protein IE889_08740 [Campylobacterales bacterium]|nr:hypothetical protein [Campylobacterales bacterium]